MELNITEEWLKKAIKSEEGHSFEVGGYDMIGQHLNSVVSLMNTICKNNQCGHKGKISVINDNPPEGTTVCDKCGFKTASHDMWDVRAARLRE